MLEFWDRHPLSNSFLPVTDLLLPFALQPVLAIEIIETPIGFTHQPHTQKQVEVGSDKLVLGSYWCLPFRPFQPILRLEVHLILHVPDIPVIVYPRYNSVLILVFNQAGVASEYL